MKRIVILTLIVSPLALLAGCGSEMRASNEAESRGLDAMQTGDYEAALGEFTKALELEPSRFLAREFRGKCRMRLGDYPAAVSDFDEAIRLAGDNKDDLASLHAQRGWAHFELGQFAEAIQDLDKAIHGNPQHGPALFYRGLAYRRLGKELLAIASLDRAAPHQPKNWKLYLERGEAHANIGARDKALDDFTHAIEFSNHEPWLYIRRGKFQAAQGSFEPAHDDYTRAIAKMADPTRALAERAYLNWDSGHFDEAIADMECAQEFSPLSVRCYNQLSCWYELRGGVFDRLALCVAAIEAYDEAQRTDSNEARKVGSMPTAAILYLDRACIYRDLQQYDLALADVLFAQELKAVPFVASEIKADIYRRLGQWDKALATSDECLEEMGKKADGRALADRAIALYHLGRLDECRQACEAIIGMQDTIVQDSLSDTVFDSSASSAHFLLARIHVDRGEAAAARAELRQADYCATYADEIWASAAVYEQLGDAPGAALARFRAIQAEGLSVRTEFE